MFFSEDSLIEQPTIEIFQSLGYDYQNCFDETFGKNSSIGRNTSSEVVLKPRLKTALLKLNPQLPPEAISNAIDELTKDRSILNPVLANEQIYKLIKEGVKVRYTTSDGEEEGVVKVIDFDNPDNNNFFVASQFWVTGELYKRRTDLIGFVNGLPLIFIELKGTNKKLEDAFNNNLTDYKDTIPQLFWYNAFIILSNGSKSKIGTSTSQWEHFAEWKKINSEGEEGIVSLDTIIKGTCEKERFLDLLENFILFQDTSGGKEGSLIKIISKNHQYLGVNNVIESFKKTKENKGKLGVFWHTQGSGKSFSMIFFSQKVQRKYEGSYTFLIVTDRKDLDKQIYKNFVDCGAVTEKNVHATNGEHLKQLLRENHRNIFTLIQKFGTNVGEKYPLLSERSDIIVITDEAHRSQYDTLALNMRMALPNASFIAFTGTPLIADEELTKNTFGDYVSIYDFRQSIVDGATVPLFYENRIPELQLEDEKVFNDDIQNIIDEAELDSRQEEKLEREFSREYHLITRDDRLNKIAEDIVEHFLNRGFIGKGMVVLIDKPTAVKMYDKVRTIWDKKIGEVKKELEFVRDDLEKEITEEKLKYLKETDMAVVVSSEQNEIEKFKKLNLKIEHHRKRMVYENMEEKFKDVDDPFRLVFVCAMWMTGFDALSISTIYLDKPMRNHTLMQAIARANRVFKDKPNGLIVDYIGVFRNLQKALAIYAVGKHDGDIPVKPKEELVRDLEEIISETVSFCLENDVDFYKIQNAGALENIKLIDDAVENLIVSDEIKNNYLSLANAVNKIFKAILPDVRASEFSSMVKLIKIITDKIRLLDPPVNIDEVMKEIGKVMDESVVAEPYLIKLNFTPIDLSKIDFESLKELFSKERKRTTAEILKNAIRIKVDAMVRLNKSRINFSERFKELIDKYNSGSLNIEKFFERLTLFAQELNEEEQRGIKENLTEEELALFDLLKKPTLTEKEKTTIKIASKSLLIKLKAERFVLDWRKRQETRAKVYTTIENFLDKHLPSSYTPEIFQQKCDKIYEHFYENYYGNGISVYEKT